MQGSTVNSTTAIGIEQGHGHGGHGAHPDHRLFGIFVFLVAEAMIFLGLFAAYLTFRAVAPEWPPAGTPKLELLLPGINTLILISSSFVVHRADEAIKKG